MHLVCVDGETQAISVNNNGYIKIKCFSCLFESSYIS